MPEVVRLLASEPVAGRNAAQARQAGRHLGRNGLLAGEQAMERRAGHPEFARRLADGQAEPR